MNDLNNLSFRLRNALPSFTPIDKPPPRQPAQSTSTSKPLPESQSSKLHAQILGQSFASLSYGFSPPDILLAKLSFMHPAMKARIVTSSTNEERYAHVIDGSEKVRYSSGAQRSVEVALEVLLALVEEDAIGLVKVEEMVLEESDKEQEGQGEVDYEMEID